MSVDAVLQGAERAEELVLAPGWVRPFRVAALAAIDMFALVFSFLCGFLWANWVKSQPLSLYAELAPLLLLFLGAYAFAGLYPGFGIGAVETIRRMTRQTSLVFVVLAAASFAMKLPATYSRGAFFITWIVSLAFLPLMRFVALTYLSRWRYWREAAIIVGTGRSARRVIELLDSAKSLGYTPIIAFEPDLPSESQMWLAGVPVVPMAKAVLDLERRGVRIALIALEADADAAPHVEWLRDFFRHVVVIPAGDTFPVEGVVIRNLGGLLGVEFGNQLLLRRNMMIKRALDLTVGSISFLLALPVILVTALFVKLFSRGPAFYSQEREGLGGVPLRVWKIRSMHTDAEARLEALLAEDTGARKHWERHLKLKDDPRIIPFIGRFIRRFSIDELPQLLQVVLGDLSLVGPRPFPAYHLQRFTPEFRALRRKVRPGLTGLWQISSRSDASTDEQMRIDSHYIRNWSVWQDVYILGRTADVVLRGRGAY